MGKKSRIKREKREGKQPEEKLSQAAIKKKNIREKLLKDFTKKIRKETK